MCDFETLLISALKFGPGRIVSNYFKNRMISEIQNHYKCAILQNDVISTPHLGPERDAFTRRAYQLFP